MLSPELRKRLSDLNRGAIKLDASRGQHVRSRTAIPLEDVVPGKPIRTPRGEFLLWNRSIQDVVPHGHVIQSSLAKIMEEGYAIRDAERFHPDVRGILEVHLSRVLYLDIETTGLGGGPVFLVGLVVPGGDNLWLQQLLARDYSEEAGMLYYLASILDGYEGLISFNGKTFDLRYLGERFIATGTGRIKDFRHLDLLFESRRRFKNVLPDCKLKTLERMVSGRRRRGDIPGIHIPRAYHEFVRTGNARSIRDILHHNALDLVTLVELFIHILHAGQGRDSPLP